MIINADKKIDDLKFQIESGITETIDDNYESLFRLPSNSSNLEQLSRNENNSYEKLKEVSNLVDLKEFIENFQLCELKKTSKNTVFSDGNSESKLMFIGEAPGQQEDLEGKPFVGKSGKLLDKILSFINLDRGNIYITNILPWRPPGNRTPTEEELKICFPIVEKHIEIMNPSIIVLVGSVSSKSILKTKLGITKIRGEWHEYVKGDIIIPCLPIFHPAYLLRRPEQKSLAWKDALLLKEKIQSLKGGIIHDH
ncbi:MAG: uracil-DNA glycosylase [Pseudomonadota bacterium]|mgnify:FL=1|nr:uracil-DNA glycosylase [Pseudomonadota bacterium]